MFCKYPPRNLGKLYLRNKKEVEIKHFAFVNIVYYETARFK